MRSGLRRAVGRSGSRRQRRDFPGRRRPACFVRRILSGAMPGDLPAGKTDGYWMVLNARRARELGIAIPPSLRQRADQVIG